MDLLLAMSHVDSDRPQRGVNGLQLGLEIECPFLTVTPHGHAVVHRNQVTCFVQGINEFRFSLGLTNPLICSHDGRSF
ncbi:hypothetical protein BN2475_270002 [Paraburkholderia ribeironis]|uniref:Uncharacterized protein n=1 Tax=Paraburkholderia ribeironis TaxID=1247936 RepID=A0A1N7RZW5_9BURK|nr:hypothetical protein BN2475_270002 [Paraburkholderia ribeironis]